MLLHNMSSAIRGPEREYVPEKPTSPVRRIVRIVVGDEAERIINFAYDDLQNTIIRKDLDKQTSEGVALSIVAQYLGHEDVAHQLGITPRLDPRIVKIATEEEWGTDITTDAVKMGKIIRQEVAHFLSLDFSEKRKYINERELDPNRLTGWAAYFDENILQKGQYFEVAGDFKFNRWGMWWELGDLDTEALSSIVEQSKTRPLREIIGEAIIAEGKQLWQSKLNSLHQHTSFNIDEYFTKKDVTKGVVLTTLKPNVDPRQVRSIEDLAINEGFVEVGEFAKGAVNYIDGNPDSRKSLMADPTGVKWLEKMLATKAVVWNEIHQERQDYDTPKDPAVMGFEAGLERYQDLYNQAVEAGAKKDTLENSNFPRAK